MIESSSPDVFANGPITVDVFESHPELDALVAAGLATRTSSPDTPNNVYSPVTAVQPDHGNSNRKNSNGSRCSAPTPARPPQIAVEPPAVASGGARPKVPTRPCTDQPEHRKALWTSKKLKEDPLALLAALAVHNLIGISQRTRFGDRPERIAASRIADETGMSVRKAKDAIGKAVELGFYRRVDAGKGGRGVRGSTAAAYVPALPDYSGR